MATLQQITTKAKVLYKTGKYKKWTDAIKAASKLVKKKPVKKAAKKKPQRVGQWVKGTTRMYEFKKEKPFKKYPKNVEVKRTRSGTFSKFKAKIGNIELPKIGSELLNLEFKISELKARKKAAKKVSEKKAIQQKITVLNNQFKTLKAYLNTRARFI
jgi:hypothetical protein